MVAAASMAGCDSDLPKDFDRLPLREQVQAYEVHLERYGHPLLHAKKSIAKHGWPAAELACDRLDRGDKRLPAYEALQIIHAVQTGGCPLKHTICESVVRAFVSTHAIDSADGNFARVTLTAIERNYTSPNWRVEPCGAATPPG